MRNLAYTCCCLVLLAALTGCANARRALGVDKQSPDEFAVFSRAPLKLPPDYGLRPPTPGAKRPQEDTTRDQARRILLGGAASTDVASRPAKQNSIGEVAILKRAGALNTDPSIRQKVNLESRVIAASDEGFLDKIIFWQDPAQPGVVVDAGKEARRLREASAMGTAPNKGAVPSIKRKEKGILEGIF